MGNPGLDACVQVVKQNASLPSLIAEALRKNDFVPTFVIDVSNIIHAQLHRHDLDIVLRHSWNGFDQGIENILKTHAGWFAPFFPGTTIRKGVCYTQEKPLENMIYVFDGVRAILNRLGMRHIQALAEAEHEMYIHANGSCSKSIVL
jgi:hypothetical protein